MNRHPMGFDLVGLSSCARATKRSRLMRRQYPYAYSSCTYFDTFTIFGSQIEPADTSLEHDRVFCMELTCVIAVSRDHSGNSSKQESTQLVQGMTALVMSDNKEGSI